MSRDAIAPGRSRGHVRDAPKREPHNAVDADVIRAGIALTQRSKEDLVGAAVQRGGGWSWAEGGVRVRPNRRPGRGVRDDEASRVAETAVVLVGDRDRGVHRNPGAEGGRAERGARGVQASERHRGHEKRREWAAREFHGNCTTIGITMDNGRPGGSCARAAMIAATPQGRSPTHPAHPASDASRTRTAQRERVPVPPPPPGGRTPGARAGAVAPVTVAKRGAAKSGLPGFVWMLQSKITNWCVSAVTRSAA